MNFSVMLFIMATSIPTYVFPFKTCHGLLFKQRSMPYFCTRDLMLANTRNSKVTTFSDNRADIKPIDKLHQN